MKPTILVQLDTDPQPSVFDSVVAVDSGVAHLFRHGGIRAEAVRDLVHGALFTRGPADLKNTAIFVGGSDVREGEAVLQAVLDSFFGPFRVSVLFDPNGCNTTAAAAVLAALKGSGGSVKGRKAAVLGASGPVGQRVARLLAREGAEVAVGSRRLDRAVATAEVLRTTTGATFSPFASGEADEPAEPLENAEIVVSAGAAGALTLPKSARDRLEHLKVAIDLNAVPPLGIEGVEATDREKSLDGLIAWGALGVGATKMKIHKKALQDLFTTNDRILDAEQCLEIGRSLG